MYRRTIFHITSDKKRHDKPGSKEVSDEAALKEIQEWKDDPLEDATVHEGDNGVIQVTFENFIGNIEGIEWAPIK